MADNLNNDNLREILLRTDIENLKQYCLTDKRAVKLCNDPHFWNEKLKLEGLPPILFTGNRKMSDYEINKWQKEIQSKHQWIILYSLMHLAYKEAEKILLVNKIETQRPFETTDGTILTNDTKSHTIESFYILSIDMVESLKKDNAMGLFFEIQYKNNQYYLKVTYENDEVYDMELIKPISYYEAVNILTLLIFDKYVEYNHDTQFMNSNDVEFWFDGEKEHLHTKGDKYMYLIYLTLNSIQ